MVGHLAGDGFCLFDRGSTIWAVTPVLFDPDRVGRCGPLACAASGRCLYPEIRRRIPPDRYDALVVMVDRMGSPFGFSRIAGWNRRLDRLELQSGISAGIATGRRHVIGESVSTSGIDEQYYGQTSARRAIDCIIQPEARVMYRLGHNLFSAFDLRRSAFPAGQSLPRLAIELPESRGFLPTVLKDLLEMAGH